MALNGLQIQKLLPKTNCKECGSNTCLAFAMKLAAKKANLSECPYASEEAKAILGADSEPPVKTVTLGTKKSISVGGETVLYRHEKTFVNQPVIAINLNDDAADMDATLEKIDNYKLERVGEILTINAVAVTHKSGDAEKFVSCVQKAWDATHLPIILRSSDAKAIEDAAKAIQDTHSVITGVTTSNAADMARIAKENGYVLAVTAENLDGLIELTGKLKEEGFNDVVVEFNTLSVSEAFQTNSIARRAAIKDSFKGLGYTSLKFIDTGDLMDDTVQAIHEIDKYGGIIVLPSFDPAQLVALMALRQNIYTDPQKPIQVEPKVYPIGEPDRNSPVFVTTNFSLTYFIVSGEIENSGISAWLVIPECEGMSVLTSWAAGKFSGAMIGKFIKDAELEKMVDTRSIVIPGYVSQISGELEEALPGWKVLVGPQEAADIESYVKAVLK